MRAVILVGGFGTRLRPLTLDLPKQMLPVGPVTMLERVVTALGQHGVTEAVLALGYLPEVFQDAYPSGEIAGVKMHYAVEPEPLDTAGAIAFAARSAGIDQTFIAINGDVLTDLDYSALVDFHHGNPGLGTIHLTPVEDPSRFGVVPIQADGLVEAFIEKPPAETAPSKWINAGTYVLEPEALHQIPEGERVSIERKVFPDLVAAHQLYAMQSDVYWVDAGTPESYLRVTLDLVNGVRASENPIGSNSEIAHDAIISDSCIGSGCTIGAGARVERSVLHDGVTVEAGAVVTDSILATGAVVGSGAHVAKLSVVGKGQLVSAGSHLHEARLPSPS